MTTKPPDLTDINALAIEACDMWQDHLSSLANDPTARAELTRFLEPQRRLFADWAAMMQQGASHEPTRAKPAATAEGAAKPESAPAPSAPATSVKQEPGVNTAAAAPSSSAAYGDDPLRAAQLALRVAELEKRIVQLESLLAGATRRA
jgi:hypothetical protein